jgi:hypothetical protein
VTKIHFADVSCGCCALGIRNVSPSITFHRDVPNVVNISTEAFAGPLRPAVDSLRQNLFNFSPVWRKVLPLYEP